MAAPLWLLPSPPPLQSSPFLSTNSSSSPSPHPPPLLCKKKQAPTRSKLLCSSSSSPSVVTKKQGEAGGGEQPVAAVLSYKDDPSFRGCKACGKEEMERGCNGEGRIQGGIATVPGFGWWPIKAYRPCPGFVASGGRYRRQGQSMDEVASGRAKNALSDRKKSGKKSGPAK